MAKLLDEISAKLLLNTMSDNYDDIQASIADLQAYLGYSDSENILGLQVDYENKVFTRLAGAVSLSAGSDFDAFNMYGGRRRCNVTDEGEIVAWYGDDNFSEDGYITITVETEEERDVTDEETGETTTETVTITSEETIPIQVMVYQPAFYYKVTPVKLEKQTDGEGYHIRCANYFVSDEKIEGFKIHPAFINADGKEVDYILYGVYEGCLYDADGGTETVENEDGTETTTTYPIYITNDAQVINVYTDELSSIANVKPASGITQQLTRPNIEILAQNRGNDWHGSTIKTDSAQQLLMIIEAGTMNVQTAYGNGVVSITDNSAYNCSSYTGSTSSLGNTTGAASETTNEINGEETVYTTNGKVAVSYRGIENPWGNIWTFSYGMNIYGNGSQKGGIPYICTDFNFAESKYDGNSDNYESAGFTVTNTSGYISALGYGNSDYDWLFIGSETSGNSSLPVGDYTYVTSDLSGYRVSHLGGCWGHGSSAGAFCWTLHPGVGYRNRYFGARVVLIPTHATSIYTNNIAAWNEQISS